MHPEAFHLGEVMIFLLAQGRCQSSDSSAFVTTIDSPSAAERVVEEVHRNWPQVPIYARARDVLHATRVIACGATHVVPETIEASRSSASRS
jgi:CPA2 family monovalent cation:H+ antiporter-2